jgi:hypothetical protein
MKKCKSAESTTARKNVQQVSNFEDSELNFIKKFRTHKQDMHTQYDEGHEAGFVIEFNKDGVNINMSLNELTCFLHHLRWDKKLNFMPQFHFIVNVMKGKTIFVAKHWDYNREDDDVRDVGKYGCYYVYNIDELDNPEIKVAELDELTKFL